MRSTYRLVAISLATSLGACATMTGHLVWVKPNSTPEQLQKASYECTRDTNAQHLTSEYDYRDMFEACMRAHGYTPMFQKRDGSLTAWD